MKIILVPILVMATIFVVSLSITKVFRAKNKESFLIIGIDGLRSLWITTLVFCVFNLIGWLSLPDMKYDILKYEIIKYISYVLFLCASILHLLYIRASKKRVQHGK